MKQMILPFKTQKRKRTNFICITIYLCCCNIYSQDTSDFITFDNYFSTLTSQLLIDDIAVKYSERDSLEYQLIDNLVRDSLGQKSIIIDNENYHSFYSLGKNQLNDSISYYLFSHNVLLDGESNYYGYLAVFNKEILSDFKTIYSNSTSGIEVYNFGSIFSKNEFVTFKVDSYDYSYYTIDLNGHIYEIENSENFDNTSFKRLSRYEIKLDSQFYNTNKVLLPIKLICKEKPKQILRRIADENLKQKTTFYIDCLKEDNHLTFRYLNELMSKNVSNVFEIVFDKYDDNCIWLENKSMSKYYIMPNGIEIVNEFLLSSF